MVKKNILNTKYIGVYKWLIVRISSIIIFLYILYLGYFLLCSRKLSFDLWHDFFYSFKTRVFTTLSLLSVLIHTWIGMWQILTDYIKNNFWQKIYHFFIISILILYLVYGILIIIGK